jgi:hypothetical protein
MIASMSGKEMAPTGHKPWQPLHPTMQWNGRSTLAMSFFSFHVKTPC